MEQRVRDYVAFVSGVLPVQSPVVEIGSYKVTGQEELADMRPFFSGVRYIGCDLRPGPGVDRVEDIHQLRLGDNFAGTLLVLETLEHVANPFQAFSELYRVLSPTGFLMISVPFYFFIHEYPSDYWRYTPYCLDMLLEKFHRIISWENADLDYEAAKIMPKHVYALAAKQQFPAEAVKKIIDYGKSNGHHFLSTESEK